MEASYRREMNHTYMILDGENPCEEYALRVLTENQLQNLLPVTVREMDGRSEYCFEVSRGKSLARILEKRQISFEEIRELLKGMDHVWKQMDEYLLDPGHLILDPAFIYGFPDLSEVRFCCHPACSRDIFQQLRSLLQFFLNKIDHLEGKNVEAAYELFRVSQQETFCFEDLLAVAESAICDTCEEPEEEKELENEPEPEEAQAPDPRDRLLQLLSPVLVLGALGIFGLAYYQKSQFGIWNLWFLGAGLLMILGAALAHGILAGERRQIEASWSGEWEDVSVPEMTESEVKAPEDLVFEDHGIRPSSSARHRALRRDDPMLNYIETEGDEWESWDVKEEEGWDSEGYVAGGETEVLYGAFSENKDPMLVSQNLLVQESLTIETLPFVLGKLADAVDGVLDRPSISRIHARIERWNDQYMIRDCSSTNGTRINGRKLEANRRYPLQSGDEVQLADLKFIFQRP